MLVNMMVKSQLEEVLVFLRSSAEPLEDFLNSATLDRLLQEKAGNPSYYKEILSSFRRLLVHCEENVDACQIILKNELFRQAAAEKVLYRIYHQCIEEYFSPKNDSWYEDSRAAYTGKNAIKFSSEVPDSIIIVLKKIESGFQTMRNELEFYETDYRNKMMNRN